MRTAVASVDRLTGALVAAALLQHFSANALALDLVEVVKRVSPATVRIETDAGVGSGVIVNDEGLVLTNYHVIQGARSVKITFSSKKAIESEGYLAVNPSHDLALLKIDRPNGVPAIPVATALPQIGEKVAALGNPRGFSFTTSEGIVSGIRTGDELGATIGADTYKQFGYGREATWIQTTAPISEGNSGGPLVNMDAELIGLSTWSHVKGQNLNFAIGARDIKSFLDGAMGKKPSSFDSLPDYPDTARVSSLSQELASFLEECNAWRLARIERCDKANLETLAQLRKAKSARVNKSGAGGAFRSREAKDARISQLLAELGKTYAESIELRTAKEIVAPILDPHLNVGDIGMLYSPLEIDQIIDGENVLVTAKGMIDQANGRLVERSFWLSGFPTSSFADDEVIKATVLYCRVAGNKRFTTVAGGSRTVMVLEKFDMAPVRDAYRPQPKPEFVEREWFDESRLHSVMATVVGFKSGKVDLRKRDGQVVSVPLHKLGKDEQEYIRSDVQPRMALREILARESPSEWKEIKASLAALESFRPANSALPSGSPQENAKVTADN